MDGVEWKSQMLITGGPELIPGTGKDISVFWMKF